MEDQPEFTEKGEWQVKRWDNECMCVYQALLLLEHLDPQVWAIQANDSGIAIYPRNQIRKITTWEKSLNQAPLPIPCDWTGYLSHSVQKTSEKWTRYSSTYSHSQGTSPPDVCLSQGEGDVSSLNRLLLLMQEYLSVGRPLEVKSMKDVCLSICKEISGS